MTGAVQLGESLNHQMKRKPYNQLILSPVRKSVGTRCSGAIRSAIGRVTFSRSLPQIEAARPSQPMHATKGGANGSENH